MLDLFADEIQPKQPAIDLFADEKGSTFLDLFADEESPAEKTSSKDEAPILKLARAERNIGKAIIKGATDIPSGIASMLERKPALIGGLNYFLPKAARGPIAEKLRIPSKIAPEIGEPGFEKGMPSFFEQSFTGLAQSAVPMAMQYLAPEVGMASIYAQMKGSKYDQLIKEGVTENKAQVASDIHALLGTPIEFMGNLIAFKGLGNAFAGMVTKAGMSTKLGKILWGLLETGIGEGAEEYGQAGTEVIADEYAKNYDKPVSEITSNIIKTWASPEFQKQALLQTAMGFTGGVTLGIGGSMVGGLAPEVKEEEEIKQTIPEDFLNTVRTELLNDRATPEEVINLKTEAPEYADRIDQILEEYKQQAVSKAVISGPGEGRTAEVQKILNLKQVVAQKFEQIAKAQEQQPAILPTEPSKVQDLAARALMGEKVSARGLTQDEKNQLKGLITPEDMVSPVKATAKSRERKKELTAKALKSPKLRDLAGKILVGEKVDTNKLSKIETEQIGYLTKDKTLLEQGWESNLPITSEIIPKPIKMPGLKQLLAKKTLTPQEVDHLVTRRGKVGSWNNKVEDKLKAIGYLKEEKPVEIPEITSTREAVEFSKVAIPEQLERVKAMATEYDEKAKRAKDEGDFDEGIRQATNAQLMREVLQAKEEPERFERIVKGEEEKGWKSDTELSPREYQEKYPEKTIHEDWNKANSPRYILESAGDVLREIQKEHPDSGYISEKINRILNNMDDMEGIKHFDDSLEAARKYEPEKLFRLISQYESQPTNTDNQKRAKDAILSLMKGDFQKAKNLYSDIEKSFLVKAPKPTEKKTKAKEPWEMTKKEYDNYVKSLQSRQNRSLQTSGYGFSKYTIDGARASDELARIKGGYPHLRHIKQALSEGKPVPKEVLVEYPELKEEAESAKVEPVEKERGKAKIPTAVTPKAEGGILPQDENGQTAPWYESNFDIKSYLNERFKHLIERDKPKGNPWRAWIFDNEKVEVTGPGETYYFDINGKTGSKYNPKATWALEKKGDLNAAWRAAEPKIRELKKQTAKYQWIAEKYSERDDIYIRWDDSKHPSKKESINAITGESEGGISVFEFDPENIVQTVTEYEFLKAKNINAVPWIVSGKKIGIGSDGEPLLDPRTIKYVEVAKPSPKPSRPPESGGQTKTPEEAKGEVEEKKIETKKPTEKEVRKGEPAKLEPTPKDLKQAKRFRTMADNLQGQIDDKRRDMTQNPTPRRMKQYYSRLHDADNLERTQQALTAMANALEAGNLPKILADIKTKDAITPLIRKGLEAGGGYYDVIPSTEYSDKSEKGKALQNLMEKSLSGEQIKEREKRAKEKELKTLEESVRFSGIPGFFATPEPIINQMIDFADVQPGMNVLEPSAGKGDIADAIKEKGVIPDVAEINLKLREILKAKGYENIWADFLEMKLSKPGVQGLDVAYDRIIQNPPFEKGQDIDHVRHAYELLKPDGRLVSVMSVGPFFRNDKKAASFREWFDEVGGTEYDLGQAFKGAKTFRQTGATSKIVVIDKPGVKYGLAEIKELKPVKITGQVQLIKNQPYDIHNIRNQRFMYNPKTAEMVLGTGNIDVSSHAEELEKSGARGDYDDFIRGWIGTSKQYKDAIIHFAPPLLRKSFSESPALFDRAMKTLEHFIRNGANSNTILRNIITAGEGRLGNLFPEFALSKGAFKPAPITPDIIQNAFPTAKIKQAGDIFNLILPNRSQIVVMANTGVIRPDPEQIRIGYGRKAKRGEVAVAAWKQVGTDGLMWLSKYAGQEKTDHEAFHAAMDLVLNNKERASVLKKHGNEENAADAYGKWKAEQEKNTIFQKIKRFFNRILNNFFPNWQTSFEKVRTGEVWERGARGAKGLVKHAYAGPESRTADLTALDIASQMNQRGKSAGEIRRDTGWFLGPDDKWRYEIDDSKAKIKNIKVDSLGIGERHTTLSEIFEHKELFKAYPELKNTLINIMIDKNMQNPGGSFTPGLFDLEPQIDIRGKNIKEAKEHLIHEIQHSIQGIEGFARGGSPKSEKEILQQHFVSASIRFEQAEKIRNSKEFQDEQARYVASKMTHKDLETRNNSPMHKEFYQAMDDLKQRGFDINNSQTRDALRRCDMGVLPDKAFKQYLHLAGEIEARDVATRAEFDEQARMMVTPYATQGIPNKEVIVRFGAKYALAQPDYKELLDQAKSRVTSRLKDERGSISWAKVKSESPFYDDLITVGTHYYNQGHQKYSDFARQMKSSFSEVWEKIRNLIKYIWNDVKTRLKSETGAIQLGRERKAVKGSTDALETNIKESITRNPEIQAALKKLREVQGYKVDDIVKEGPALVKESRGYLKKRFGKGYTDNDIGLLKRIYSLPYWLAKKYKSMDALVKEEIRASEKRSTELFRDYNESDLGDIQNEIPKDKVLYKELRDIIWKWESKRFSKKDVPTDWHKELVEGEDIEINPKHYEEIEKYLIEQEMSPQAVHAFVTIRKKLDEKYVDIDKTLRIEKLEPTLIEEYRAQVGKIHNYFPHRRTGDSYVQVSNIKEKDPDKKTVYREHYNSFKDRALPINEKARARAESWIKEAIEKGEIEGNLSDYNIKLGAVKSLPDEIFFQIPVESMQQVLNVAGTSLEQARIGYEAKRLYNIQGKTKEEALELAKKRLHADMEAALSKAVSDVLKSRGWGRHAILRKGIPGHETEDIFGILFDYLGGYTGFKTKIERAKNHSKVLREINARKNPNEYSYASRYVKDVLANQDKVDRLVDGLRAMFFVKYLGFIPKSGAINLTQNIVLAAPTLSVHTKGGLFRAERLIAKAMKDTRKALTSKQAWTQKGETKYPSLPKNEQTALHEMIEAGTTMDLFLRELQGSLPGKGWTKYFNKVLQKSGLFMQIAEKWNRASTGLAAYRVGIKEKGMPHDEAVQFAKQIIYDSHFLYGKSNLPELMRGGDIQKVLRSAYTFRSFTHNYLQAMANLATNQGFEGKKAFMRSLRNLFLLGGLTSVPFFKALSEVLLWAIGDDDEDAITMARAAMPQDWLKDLVTYGLPGVTGIDLTGSLSIEVPTSWNDLIGVPYALIEDSVNTIESLKSGATFRALSETPFTPLSARNAMRGLELYTKGQRTTSGVDINYPGERGPRKITGKEAILKSIGGFQPTSVSKGYGVYKASKKVQGFVQKKKSNWADRFVNALKDGDIEEGQEIRSEIQEWNARALEDNKRYLIIHIEDAVEYRLRPNIQGIPKNLRMKVRELSETWQ